MAEQRTEHSLLAQIGAWLLSDKGRKYACARNVGVSHDETCEACLLIAAQLELEQRK